MAITIDVKVGDTILGGKFKNKRIKVKEISKDEHGMPTINGKKVVTFRIPKLKELVERVDFLDTAKQIVKKQGLKFGTNYFHTAVLDTSCQFCHVLIRGAKPPPYN